MNKPKYIVSFLCFAGEDERKALYFSDEKNAQAVYDSLNDNCAVCDLYLSQVLLSGKIDSLEK